MARRGHGAGATLALWAVLMIGALADDARGQLISPGKLSRAHAELEGIGNCTRCHALRVAGPSAERCLACHEPLAKRLQVGKGYHATLQGRACAECHKEHFGEDFVLVRFDSLSFDHETIGFELEGRHGELGCRECHAPALVIDPDVRRFKDEASALERTYLGLGTLCVSCHEADDPHEGQFAERSCDECHGQTEWEKVERFDHDATRYRLTGLHRRVRCRDCHRPLEGSPGAGRLRFTGLDYDDCDACHRDAHRGVMGQECARCHGTDGWNRIADRSAVERTFDHSTTDFVLAGAHARAECDACHAKSPRRDDRLWIEFVAGTEQRAFPRPVAADCASCHVDYHEGAFTDAPGGTACDGCHTEDDWAPTNYGIERHNREAKFHLTGAHVPVICSACHGGAGTDDEPLRFRIADQTCAACHAGDDPHAGQFGRRECTECHDTASFTIAAFDHSKTRWPLDGAHRDVACASCHAEERMSDGAMSVRYRPLETECKSCHREEP